MCYCVVSNSLYCRVAISVCLFRRDQIFVDFVQFLIHDNLWSFIYIIMMFKV